METKTYERKYKRFLPTETSDAIMIALKEFRYLNTEFLRALVDCKPGYISRRIMHMRDDYGLLYEPPAERGYEDYRCAFKMVGLSPNGEKYLEEKGLTPFQVAQIHKRKPNKTNGENSFDEVKVRNYDHSQLIITTLASIKIACIEHGLEFIPWGKIKEQHKSDLYKRMPFRLAGMSKEKFIIPDGLFGIRYPNGKVSYFALEAEHKDANVRGDITQNCFKRKVLAYRQAIRENEYHRSVLGISNLRVLVVSGSADKVDNQLAVVEEEYGESGLFLFAHVPDRAYTNKTIKPFPSLLTTPLKRAGMSPKPLFNTSTEA